MKPGNYSKKKYDISLYSCPYFVPQDACDYGSCGENAFYTITDKWPKHSGDKSYNAKKHLPSWKMVELLVQAGYWVFELTKSGPTNHNYINNLIRKHHVLLLNQRFNKKENSWQILHDNIIHHNFMSEQANPLEFINRPIENAYVIFHPKWTREWINKSEKVLPKRFLPKKIILPKNKWNVV